MPDPGWLSPTQMGVLLGACAVLMSGCAGSPGEAADPLAPGDTIVASPGPSSFVLDGCEMMNAGAAVPKAWVDPITPPDFEADDGGFGHTTLGFSFFECERVEFANVTYAQVGLAFSSFNANPRNQSWGPNATGVMVDLVVDSPDLAAALRAFDIPAQDGTVDLSFAIPGGLLRTWSAAWGDSSVRVPLADHDVVLRADHKLDLSEWSVNETAWQWEIGRTESDALVLDLSGSVLEIEGTCDSRALFGGLSAYPVVLVAYENLRYDIVLSGGFPVSG